MNAATSTSIEILTSRLEQVLDLCRRLSDGNRSLRASQEQLIGERANLLSKSEQARPRVDAMIPRLNTLAQNPSPRPSTRSAALRVLNECVRTCKSGASPYT